MKTGLWVLSAGFLFAPSLAAQSSVNPPNAAAVRSAQVVYQTVEAARKRRELIRHDTTVVCAQDSLEAHGSSYVDRDHRIRRLDTETGTGDHAERVATYFDTLGRARFSFAQRAAVNGTHQEERVYYDEHGKVVRHQIRQTHGPGYPFDTLSTVPHVATWIGDLCG